MKLIKSYSLALYSAEQCTLYNKNEIDKQVDLSPQSSDFIPDALQLVAIQQSLALENWAAESRIVILVPDHWLSISNSILDSSTPPSLMPLAALTYAVESTFSTPEMVWFNYQKKRLEDNRIQLSVFACSEEWSKQLCSPFSSKNASCLIVPVSLWQNIKPRSRRWSTLSRHALSHYQPDHEKQRTCKRLWCCLLVLSVLVHSLAYGYFSSLEQRIHLLLTDRQSLLERQTAWATHQDSNDFVFSVLGLMQELPTSVRLVSFDGGSQQADFQLTLTQEEFAYLFSRWEQDFPHWHWQVFESFQAANSISLPVESNQEVLDVFVSVFEKK